MGYREPFLEIRQENMRPDEPAESKIWGEAFGRTPEQIAQGCWCSNTTVVQIPIDSAVMRVVAKVQTGFHVSEEMMQLFKLVEVDWSPSPLGYDVLLKTIILEVTFPAKFYVSIIHEETARSEQLDEIPLDDGSRIKNLDQVVTVEKAASFIGVEIDGEFVLRADAVVQPEFAALAFPRECLARNA